MANGISVGATGTVDTGVLAPTAGYALYALNNGTITGTPPLTLITGAPFSAAARAETGGTITLDSVVATTNGATFAGPWGVLEADGAGSIITATNPTLTANGDSGYGARATNGGAITLTGGTIDTFGPTAVGHGLNATTGSNINASGMTITMTGIGAYAAGGTMTLDDMIITERLATGNISGIRADTPSGLITATNLTITTSGANSIGVLTTDGATIRINDSSVTTSGSGGFGLDSSQSNVATGTHSLLEATNVSVTQPASPGMGPLPPMAAS